MTDRKTPTENNGKIHKKLHPVGLHEVKKCTNINC